MTSDQVDALKKLLADQALFQEPPETCAFGVDGSQWIFELVDRDGYKMVKRWSPEKGSAQKLGKHLIALSEWDIDTY